MNPRHIKRWSEQVLYVNVAIPDVSFPSYQKMSRPTLWQMFCWFIPKFLFLIQALSFGYLSRYRIPPISGPHPFHLRCFLSHPISPLDMFFTSFHIHQIVPQGHHFVGHVGVLRCAAVVAGVGSVRALGVFLRAAPCRGCGPHRTSETIFHGITHLSHELWSILMVNNHYKDPYYGWDDHQPYSEYWPWLTSSFAPNTHFEDLGGTFSCDWNPQCITTPAGSSSSTLVLGVVVAVRKEFLPMYVQWLEHVGTIKPRRFETVWTYDGCETSSQRGCNIGFWGGHW